MCTYYIYIEREWSSDGVLKEFRCLTALIFGAYKGSVFPQEKKKKERKKQRKFLNY